MDANLANSILHRIGCIARLLSVIALVAACAGGDGTDAIVTPASVSVSAPTLALQVGDALQLSVTARLQSGEVVPDTAPTWASSDPEVAAVSGDGLVRGLKIGTATITAVVNGVSGTLVLTITTAPDGGEYVVSTLAGLAGEAGSSDGIYAQARFNQPSGIAVDASGNVYVADTGNNTIRKVDKAGVVSTLAGFPGGYGFDDGTGAAARFGFPVSIAADKAGNLYVADQGTHVIRMVTSGGVVTTIAGSPGQFGFVDGPGPQARFHQPDGVAIDDAGNVFVSDAWNNAIRRISPDGVVSTLAASSTIDTPREWGPDTLARIASPIGLEVDLAGNVYVANGGANTVLKVSPSGVVAPIAGYFGFNGSTDGTGVNARFNNPFDIAVDKTGDLYVTDIFNCTIRRIVADGVVTTFAGAAGSCGATDGSPTEARFNSPWGIAIDAWGNIYVADRENHTIRKIVPSVVPR